jgi:hypothetical protein
MNDMQVFDMVKSGFLNESRTVLAGLSPLERNRVAYAARLLAALCDMVTAHELVAVRDGKLDE